MRHRHTDYLIDEARSAATITRQERGVLDLLAGLDSYTRNCAPAYADACAAHEFEIGRMFEIARAMLTYAPDTLRRGAISSAIGDLMRAWSIDPDTGEWIGA